MYPSWSQTGHKHAKVTGPSWDRSVLEQNKQSATILRDSKSMEGFGAVRETVKGLPSTVGSILKGGFQGAKQGFTDIKHPSSFNQAKQESGELYANTILEASDRFAKAYDSWTKNTSKLDKTVGTGMAGLGAIHVAFAPITSSMRMLAGVPVVGRVATGVEKLFGAIGGGFAGAAVTNLQQLPIQEESKTKLEPLVAETASLIGQIAAGKASHSAGVKIKNNVLDILDVVHGAKNIPGVMNRTPGIGKDAPQRLPVVPVPTRIGVNRVGSTKPQSVGIRETLEPRAIETRPLPELQRTPLPTKRGTVQEGALDLARAEGTQFQSRTNVRLSEEARARGIEVQDAPIRTSRVKAEDVQRADAFVSKSPEKALEVIRERATPPNNVLAGDVYKALEARAIATKDPALLRQLIDSPVGMKAGQELQALNRDVFGNNRVSQTVRDIENARREFYKRDKESAKELKAQAKKIEPPTRDAWVDFIRSIEC
jgi:hypothetical protein